MGKKTLSQNRFDARDCALLALMEVETGRHAEMAIRPLLDRLADDRDRALANEIFYGVLRWRLRLDAEINPRLAGKTDPRLLQILRIGLYQLRFLDRVPEHAAVNTAVSLAKRHGLGRGAGFVNAVLRAIQRGPAFARPEGHDPKALAIRYAHPDWLVRGWIEQYGLETTRALLAADQRPALTVIRVRHGDRGLATEWLRERGARVEPSPFLSPALRVEGGGDPQRWPAVRAGDWVLQDDAAQAMADLLPSAKRHLDLCAAPGGKSFFLADRDSDALILAIDQAPERLRTLLELRERLGLTKRILAVIADATRPVVAAGRFFSVLVDAPCSGLGTLRRNPDRKWRKPPDPGLPQLQRAILKQAGEAVAPGGYLLYVTCTLWKPENEGVALAFERAHPDFERMCIRHPFQTEEGFYQSWPHQHGTDGFFAALWRRRMP